MRKGGSTPDGGADPVGLVARVGRVGRVAPDLGEEPQGPQGPQGPLRTWLRNVSGLQRHAQEKAAMTQQRAEAALTQLVTEHRQVTFRAVAAMGHVSTAWLYAHEDLKHRIMRLRAQQTAQDPLATPTPVWIPPRERATDASKERIIAALRTRVAEQQALICDLRQQLEVAYGLVQAQRLGER